MKNQPITATDTTSTRQIIDFSKQLMAIESIEANIAAQDACLDLFETEFSSYFKMRRYNFNGHPALVMSTTDQKTVNAIISGHIDVVKGDKKLFTPTEADGRLFGRGAYDMKAGLVACAYAAADYVKNGGQKDIAVMITADEETTGKSTEALLEQEGYRGEIAIIADGGDDTTIVLKQKGGIHLKIALNGTSAHAAYPWRGDSALIKAYNLHNHISTRFPQPSIDDQWQTSVLLSRIETDNSINQIPGLAHAYFDIRYVNNDHITEIRSIINDYTGSTDSVTVLTAHDLFETDINHPHIHALQRSIQKHNDKAVVFGNENGASDASFFSQHNIPTALFRPIGGNLHEDSEWVDVQSLRTTYLSVVDFLENMQ